VVGRIGDYLFKRKNSQNWHIRIQQPKGLRMKNIVRSLGTPDRVQAEALAYPLIAEHKQTLAFKAYVKTYAHTKSAREFLKTELAYPAGKFFTTPEGEMGFADETTLHFQGPPARQEPNERYMVIPTSEVRPDLLRSMERLDQKHTPDADRVIMEEYFLENCVGLLSQKTGMAVFETFKEVVQKPFKNTTRADVRRLVDHYTARGLRSSGIARKMKFLAAAVNVAILNEKLVANPFTKAIRVGSDVVQRAPLSEAECSAVEALLNRPDDRLLWSLLRHTGMRLDEAWQIVEDDEEWGIRCITFGSKTPSSRRKIPIPAALLPMLPTRIEGCLFSLNSVAMGQRLGRRIRAAGIPRFDAQGREKVLHGLRHRAQDRLRAAGCPQDKREAILGHGKRTVADGYGEGFPMTELKHWVNQIG